MSGPPIKRVSDDAAKRSGQEPERRFSYFTPQKRRATVYEDVTIDTQPSVHRHLDRGWWVSFEDGRGTWNDDSTALRSSDWYAFRDPAEIWERPYYQRGAKTEAQLESAVGRAVEEGLFEDLDPQWLEFLRENMQVQAFVEHGLWLATASVGRDCLSDSITRAVVFGSAGKQRVAQSIVLYAMDLEPHLGEFPVAPAKERWLEDPSWQPARAFVERLHASCDWGEVIVAANLCFEPLFGAAVRRELGIRAATAHDDAVTPVIFGAAQEECAWITQWSAAFTRFVLDDPAHGDHNRSVLTGWLADWLPEAEAASDALLEMSAERLDRFSSEEARARIRTHAERLHTEAGLIELIASAGATA